MMSNETKQKIRIKIKEAYERKRINNKKKASIWKTIGQHYQSMRKMLKISRQELADKMECSVTVITRFEQGKNINMRSTVEKAYVDKIKEIQKDRENVLPSGDTGVSEKEKIIIKNV